MRNLFLLTGVALLLVATPLVAQDEPRLQEEIDVNAVLVDVTVTDGDGNQILGLGTDDFVVREDGEIQEIADIDYFTNRRLLTEREEDAAFDVERVRQQRYFILFFHKYTDMPTTLSREVLRARNAAEKFVRDEILDEDYVAVVGYDARLKVYTDFTSDEDEILAALNDAVAYGKGVLEAAEGENPSILENIPRSTLIETGNLYGAIDLLADSVESIAARKVLVMFSPGYLDFRYSDSLVQYDQKRFESMLQALNESNVTVYVINTLQPGRLSDSEDFLHNLAAGTGGEYYRLSTNYRRLLQRIENENSGYYLLTYYRDRPKGEHGYQEIDVEVRNPEFQVKSARQGYRY